MTNTEYKQAMRDLGYKRRGFAAKWIERLGISESTHKKYSGGFHEVSPSVEQHIKTLLKYEKAGA